MRPITMQVNYTLTNMAVPVSHAELEPVLDDYIPTTVTAQVYYLIYVVCWTSRSIKSKAEIEATRDKSV